MKNRKISIAVFVTIVCMLFAAQITVSAEKDVVVSLQINNPIMEVNGSDCEIDAGRGTTPVISGGRTLVPIRAIIEAYDGTVSWDGTTQSAVLKLNGDTIKLTVNSKSAYFNNSLYTLDTAPQIINGRTMLPIRFIAEKFNFGVAWNDKTRTVSLITNTLDDSEYRYLMSVVPAYSGKPYIVINQNVPMFKEYEIIDASFEYYSNLDELGRCDVCMASIDTDIMPIGERGDISSVKPSGWINKRYDVVPGGYLYNRCHLIGYQLTGENANKRNLITGTRYLNIEGMLPLENKVDNYIDSTGNSVMYRVTPVFKNSNLVADGVLIEAYSVEDNGNGISFCVYCYNVQPSVIINYLTGESSVSGGTSSAGSTVSKPVQQTATSGNSSNLSGEIYRTPTGKRYHLDPDCGGKNSYKTTMNDALAAGLTPCQKCVK